MFMFMILKPLVDLFCIFIKMQDEIRVLRDQVGSAAVRSDGQAI